LQMKEIKESVKEKMDDAKSQIEVERANELLKGQRCRIQFKS
jgi:hypothetical protein